MARNNTLFEFNGDFRSNFPSALHKAAGTDDLRPALQHIVFTNGHAYVSDANCIVRQSLNFINIEGFENLEGKRIHSQIFRRIYNEKNVIVVAHPDCIEVKYPIFHTSVKYAYSTDDSKAPDFESVINNAQAKKESPIPQFSKIGINPRLFARLISAMHINCETTQVVLALPEFNSRAILVIDTHYDNKSPNDQLGLIMPAMLTDY